MIQVDALELYSELLVQTKTARIVVAYSSVVIHNTPPLTDHMLYTRTALMI